MIYLDTSVALAHLLAEDRRPPDALWSESLVSSRLLEYEMWVRLHARGLAESHGEATRELLSGVALVELVRPVLVRALDSFPVPVRTLDALHLATVLFLREHDSALKVATFDQRMADVSSALGLELAAL